MIYVVNQVLIVGPPEHGKSTLAQILAAYAVRLDRTPLMVDLDTDQGSFCIPGCLTAVPLDKNCLSVEVISLTVEWVLCKLIILFFCLFYDVLHIDWFQEHHTTSIFPWLYTSQREYRAISITCKHISR